MSFYETEAGEAISELVYHWRFWHMKEMNHYLKVRVPSFLIDFSHATDREKPLLDVIKANLSPEQWNNLPRLLNEAVKYLPSSENTQSKVRRKQEERHEAARQRIEAERRRRQEHFKIEKEKSENEQRRHKEILKIERVKKEVEYQRGKGERDRLAEEKRIKKQKYEAARKKTLETITNLFNGDFLTSREIWMNKLSNQVSEEEFNELSARFVVSWFEKQGWTKPDQEQARCIAKVWDNIQVIARAGSGKTATIVNRAAFLVKHCGVSPSEILLLAFNREAAKEVNDRLHKLLGERAPQAMTFHALAYALVHPEEALIYDDEMNGFSKSSTVQHVIDTFIRDTSWSVRIKELMLRYFRADWDEIVSGGYNLDPKEMIEYRRSLSYLGLDGKNYKSKGEKRLADYLFEHDVPYKYEKNFWWDGLNYKPDFTIPPNDKILKGIVIEYFGMAGDTKYDEQTQMKRIFWKNRPDYLYIELFPGQADSMEVLDQAVGIFLQNCGFKMLRLTDQQIWHRIKKRALGDFSSIASQFISRCRKKMISPEDLQDMVKKQFGLLSKLQVDFLGVVWKIYQEYLQILVINEEEDFDGLLIRAEEIVKTGKSCWQRKAGSGNLRLVKYLFIDEYQDFSLLFYQLVSAIKNINQDIKLFCVGDDWQAINGFAGSDLCFFKDFKQYFPDSQLLKISSNYRSYKNIINIGNELMYGEGTSSKGVLPQMGEFGLLKLMNLYPMI